ncbi:MAG: TetR family transcriptional regulator C-terminal domain-containing protein [Cyclobacteriaceae bacterium]|jgi:AcrR family transcriptional regulator|nr:TetR family transcriptional regulator C-terminal domain-containing protein [Cyclobacteriaceae bacterium]
METTKKTKGKSTTAGGEGIRSAYRKYVLTHGKQPASVFVFCEELGMTEEEFYAQFGSFEALEKAIWTEYVTTVRERLLADENYAAFSAREKILSFYFTLAELLKADRSFVLLQLKAWKNPAQLPVFLKGFKGVFDEWINGVITQGIQNGEVAKRPLLDQRYDGLFWLHLMFILQFWSHDESANFEKTDAAIEKSVNLAFDLIGKGILDNALDFGKFLYQSSKN